jgi:hypothetical protein
MKTCLITTTIHTPDVLNVYRAFGQGVEILVAGDKKTNHAKVRGICDALGNARYFSDEDQEKLGTRCHATIGWNTVRRRNLVLLEAIKRKADIIITIDDDNLPIAKDYFDNFISILKNPFSGLCVAGKTGI